MQGRPAAEIKIWKIDVPNLTITYSRRTVGKNEIFEIFGNWLWADFIGLLTLDSWVDCGDLEEHNAIHDVCKRGFVEFVSLSTYLWVYPFLFFIFLVH